MADAFYPQPERVQGHFPYISTRAVIAGLLVSIFVFTALTSLGAGVGGLALVQVIENRAGGGLPMGAAIWFALSTLLALFCGGYFAARVSNFITPRIGAAQGLVIASVFFVMVLWQIGMTVGWLGAGVGGILGTAGRAAGAAAERAPAVYSSPQVQALIDRATANLNLRSDPEVVAQGVASRLISGNEEGAKSYLAYQANISVAEADRRLTEIRNDFTAAIESAGQTAARVLSGFGWALFGMMALGAFAATFGGGVGSRENLRHPISIETREAYTRQEPAGV